MGRTPSDRFDVVSATPSASFSPCDPSRRRLDALATDAGEKFGLAFPAGLETLPLLTVAQPMDEYPDTAMIDMEASGFFRSASSITAMERIHCLKIISDNLLNPARNIGKQSVIDLVTENIHVIEQLLEQLRNCPVNSDTATS